MSAPLVSDEFIDGEDVVVGPDGERDVKQLFEVQPGGKQERALNMPREREFHRSAIQVGAEGRGAQHGIGDSGRVLKFETDGQRWSDLVARVSLAERVRKQGVGLQRQLRNRVEVIASFKGVSAGRASEFCYELQHRQQLLAVKDGLLQ